MSKPKHNPEVNLKGTLVSVLGVGVIIVAMWFIVYLMYVAL